MKQPESISVHIRKMKNRPLYKEFPIQAFSEDGEQDVSI
jgi:hypothetical protein